MKEEIIKVLQKYHQKQGIAFLSKEDAEDYFKGLVEIIEKFYYFGIKSLKDTNNKQMINKLIEELKKDKSEGSYYYGWQANIAVAMQDAYKDAKDKSDIHKISNDGAKRFLETLIR